MGVEKQRKQEDDSESSFTLRSQPFDVDESGTLFSFSFYFCFCFFFSGEYIYILCILIVTLCFLCNLGLGRHIVIFFFLHAKCKEFNKVMHFECLHRIEYEVSSLIK